MENLNKVKKYFKEDHLNRPLIKHFYYHLAIFVSWIAVSFNISAHIVNLTGLFSTILAACLILFLGGKWMILAGILVMFGCVIDLSDGTVARFYDKKNAMGKWLDESSGFIGISVVFFALMIKTFLINSDIWIIVLGTYAIFSYMMMNMAAILSELIRARFNLENPVEGMRNKLSKTFFGIHPGAFAFSLDIQWTIVGLGVIFSAFYSNMPYLMLGLFSIISSVQWMARYVIFYGK